MTLPASAEQSTPLRRRIDADPESVEKGISTIIPAAVLLFLDVLGDALLERLQLLRRHRGTGSCQPSGFTVPAKSYAAIGPSN